METVKVEIEVAKAPYDLGMALAKVTVAVKDALKDGAQASDIPVVLAALLSSDLVSAVKGMGELGADWSANKQDVINAFVLAVEQMLV